MKTIALLICFYFFANIVLLPYQTHDIVKLYSTKEQRIFLLARVNHDTP